MSLTWQSWTSVSEGRSTAGAPVAAVSWENSFALFVADPGGGIYAIKAEPGFGWELVPGRSSRPGGHITAVHSENRFTLFMADVNGGIFRTSGIPYQGWDPWTSVSEGTSTPGAPVTAVPWENSFALFIADPGGGIYAIRAEPGFGWELVPGRSSRPGGHITAVHSENRFTLFMADVNGEIFRTSGIPYQGWDPWTSVSEGRSTPGAPVAAVPWENSFALFVADPGGGIYAIKAEPGFGWELVPGRSSRPGAQVTAVRWNQPVASSSSFLLFMADVSGEIFMTSGIPYEGWDPWTSPSEGASTPGAPVTVVPSQAYALHFALFIADPSGGLYRTSPAPPPAPTGLHLISLSTGGTTGTRQGRFGWTAVIPVSDSKYKIGYEITYYRADSSGTKGTAFSDRNEAYITLQEGHTYKVYVQTTYFLGNVVVVPDAQSPPSNTIVVSIPISPLPASLSANVITNPADNTNYVLSITGSNFGKGEQVLISVVWSVEGHSPGHFQLEPKTTNTLVGGFSTVFTGVVSSGLCPISVPDGQPQPPQMFQVTAKGLTSNKEVSTTAGPPSFRCP